AHEPVVLSPVVAAARRVMGAHKGSQTLRVDLSPGPDPLRALIAASRDVPQELTRLPLGALLDLRRRAVSVGRSGPYVVANVLAGDSKPSGPPVSQGEL